jgi:hypothetical protein
MDGQQDDFFLVSLKDFVFYTTHSTRTPDAPNQAAGNTSLIINAQPPTGLRTRKGKLYVGY